MTAKQLNELLRSLPEITERRVRVVSQELLKDGAWHPEGSGSLENMSQVPAMDLSNWRKEDFDKKDEKKALSWVFDPLMAYLSNHAICSLLVHYRPGNGTWDYRAFSPVNEEEKWGNAVCQTMRALSLHHAAREHKIESKILLPVDLLHETPTGFSLLMLLGEKSELVGEEFAGDHDIRQLDWKEDFNKVKQNAERISQQRTALEEVAPANKIKDRFNDKAVGFCWDRSWKTHETEKEKLQKYIEALPELCSSEPNIEGIGLDEPLGKWKKRHPKWDVSECLKRYIGWLHELSPDIQAVLAIPAWSVERATDGATGDATGALVIAFSQMPSKEELSQIPLVFRIGASFAYVAAQVARNVAKHAFRSAVVGLQARSMAHNLGSHLLPNTLKEIELPDDWTKTGLPEIQGQIQEGKELVQSSLEEEDAEPLKDCLDNLQEKLERSFPSAMLSSAIVEYMRDRMIWTGLSAGSLSPFPVDLPFGEGIFHPLSKVELERIWGRLLADEDVESVSLEILRDDSDILVSDLLAAVPYAYLGVHALHSILENLLRNAAKYRGASDEERSKELTLKLQVRKQSEWLEIVVWDNWSVCTRNAWRTINTYCVPNPKPLPDSPPYSRDPYLYIKDQDSWQYVLPRTTEAIEKGGGIKEMRIACAWLRGENLSQEVLHGNQNPPFLQPVLGFEEEEPETEMLWHDSLKRFLGWRKQAERRNRPGNLRLGYRFYIPRPRHIAVVSNELASRLSATQRERLTDVGVGVVGSLTHLAGSPWIRANCLVVLSDATGEQEFNDQRLSLPLRLFVPNGKNPVFSQTLDDDDVYKLNSVLSADTLSNSEVIALVATLMWRWAATNLIPDGQQRTVLLAMDPNKNNIEVDDDALSGRIGRAAQPIWLVDDRLCFLWVRASSEDPLKGNGYQHVHVYDDHESWIEWNGNGDSRVREFASYQKIKSTMFEGQVIPQLQRDTASLTLATLVEGALPAVVVADARLSACSQLSGITVCGETVEEIRLALEKYSGRYVILLMMHLALFEKEKSSKQAISSLLKHHEENGTPILIAVTSDRSRSTFDLEKLPDGILFVPAAAVRRAVRSDSKAELVQLLLNARGLK